MKYSQAFERDFSWYLAMRHMFILDGVGEYLFRRCRVVCVEANINKNLSEESAYKLLQQLVEDRKSIKFTFYTEPMFTYDPEGMDGKRAFYEIDSKGKPVRTRHPNVVAALVRAKRGANLHIHIWAEDRARGLLSRHVFMELSAKLGLLPWVIRAVEIEKYHHYKGTGWDNPRWKPLTK